MKELHCLDSEFHKALRGGNLIGSSRDQQSRVINADYRAMSVHEDLAGSSKPRDPVPFVDVQSQL